MNKVLELIESAIQFIKKIFRRIINGILNFTRDVILWFQEAFLDQNKHVPFIADTNKIKDLLKTAPVKNVGIFKGVYNQQTDEIERNELIEADNLDQQTKSIIGNETLVVLN